jgi:hypothetical protein
MDLAQRRRNCSLYVSGDDREDLLLRLHTLFGGELDGEHLILPDHRISIFRNSLRWRTEPETYDFVSWRTVIEIDPTPLVDDSTVLRLVTDAVSLMRSLGRQAVAVCDFDDEQTGEAEA